MLLHPMGEEALDFKFLPACGQPHPRGSDERLTAYGGQVAWEDFPERCSGLRNVGPLGQGSCEFIRLEADALWSER